MKKSLIALAVLAASGAAMAQSSVTLFGIVDATYAYGSGSVANKSQLTNSGYNSSRLGFRGVEDLGGGMSASFHLEAGLNNDNGSGATTSTNNQGASGVTGGGGLTFNRRSTVSLNGGFGDDTFIVKAFALVGSQDNLRERDSVDISGDEGADLIQYAVNAPVNINGGEGFDIGSWPALQDLRWQGVKCWQFTARERISEWKLSQM